MPAPFRNEWGFSFDDTFIPYSLYLTGIDQYPVIPTHLLLKHLNLPDFPPPETKMFGRRKKNPPASSTIPSDGIPFLTASDLLSPHERLIKKIRNDAGCTREYFDNYYLPALERLAEMLQLRPFGHEGEYAKKGGAIEVAIKRVCSG